LASSADGTIKAVSAENNNDPIVCHCLNVTEAELVAAIRSHQIRSVRDVTRHTQAGDACTACRPQLLKLLKDEGYLDSSSDPKFSAK
jgi:NAD(P)H-nitrite reductase large subunit